ncbi:MAG: prepilin-type cleavage/methylation domain-containing protein [Polyangiaceae bacterium]|nr:prepilin-type cleavage/methylation domain-containing protein [Polyangiaceae bacterium]
MSLIETMIVVALIAILTVSMVFGSGMLSSNRLRGSAVLVVSGVKRALIHANSTGKPVRLVFDFGASTVRLEETRGRMLLSTEAAELGDNSAGAKPSEKIADELEADAERLLSGPQAPQPQFVPAAKGDFNGESPGAGRELLKGISFGDVQTSHDDNPVNEGYAYLYFWPGGGTERAAIQLRREGDGDDGLTVVVSPLTGRARIKRGLISLEEPREDAFGLRDEE